MARADGSLNAASSAPAAAAAVPEEAGVGVDGTCGAVVVEAGGAGAGALGVATGAALAGVDGPPAAGLGYPNTFNILQKVLDNQGARDTYFRYHAYYEPLFLDVVRLNSVCILKNFA